MNKPILSLVVAIGGKNRVIGKNNKLPWHIPDDLKRFKDITNGHPIIMGRKTFQSIGRALPNRTNIIITHDRNFKAEGCVVVSSLEDAIAGAKKIDQEEIYIIGGGEIFKQAITIADKLYLTVVEGEFKGDVFFPDYSDFKHILAQSSHHANDYTYTFIDLVRSDNP